MRVDVHDAEVFEKHIGLAVEAVQECGGEFLARGGRCEQLTGDGRGRNVIIRFADFEAGEGVFRESEVPGVPAPDGRRVHAGRDHRRRAVSARGARGALHVSSVRRRRRRQASGGTGSGGSPRSAGMSRPRINPRIRYEPDEPCPPLVTFGVALQGVVLVLANTVLMVTIVVGAAGADEVYLTWAVFAALIIAGVTTALQAAHVGRFGAGHILMTGAGPHFIAISVVALREGGLPTLAKPHRHFVAVSVCHGRVAAVPATDSHADRVRHRAHADRRHGHADSRRQGSPMRPRVRRRPVP